MPRRFALALLLVLVLVLAALLGARALRLRVPRRPGAAVPTARPTPVVPPTPIPGRRIALWFESPADEKLHPEARDVPESTDAVALLRSIASAVLEGPRRADLLKPFPDGWRLRGAYRLTTGVVVLDLAPPPVPPSPEGTVSTPRWNAGSHEEETAIQTLLVSLAKSLPDVGSAVLLVGGEPAETLGGHVDLTHPLRPDLSRAADEPLGPPPPIPPEALATRTPELSTPTPSPMPLEALATRTPGKGPRGTPGPSPAPRPGPRRTRPATESI
jgi:hypothetical protein